MTTTHSSRRRAGLAAVATAVLLAVGACGSNNQVGTGVKVNLRDQVNQQRLGATTSSVAPLPSSTIVPHGQVGVGGTATTAAPPTTARPVATTTPTTQPQAVYWEIAINSDSSGSGQFVPSASRVYTGTLVRFTNKDTVARSVVSDTGAFNSGPIAPGGTWIYKASAAGSFNYHDGTRPYAVGTLQVISR